jgi:hypothetical protein
MTCFMLIYLLDEMICGLNLFRSLLGGRVTAAIPIMHFFILATFLATLTGIFLGRQIWREAQQTDAEQQNGRDRFIGQSAVLLGGLFAFLTLALAAVTIVLDPC